jgi:hypothetical protein
MRRRRWILGLAVLAAWSAAVVWSSADWRSRPAVPALPERCAGTRDADATLFLVGDAGAPRRDEPLLAALRDEASAQVRALGAARVAIAFLGDNIYPKGLRQAAHPARAEDERRLLAQLDVVRESGARGFFVPGNHDWSNGGDDGWDAVKRQTRFVAARGASVVPPHGCAGPVALPLGTQLELVFLDTQWWLQDGPKPQGGDSGCATGDAAAVEAALRDALAAALPRHGIVVAHHPLATGGPHGARFGWMQHLFPFRELSPWGAWMPVPLLGSIWPLLRIYGFDGQDATSRRYREMAASIRRALTAAPPLVCAAGHDHDLQLIRDVIPRFHVVSGAGTAANVTWALPVDGTLYAAAVPGYVRLDAFADGAVEIAMRVLDERGAATDALRACLGDAPRSARLPR